MGRKEVSTALCAIDTSHEVLRKELRCSIAIEYDFNEVNGAQMDDSIAESTT